MGEGWGEGDIIGLASFICRGMTAFLIGLWVKEDFRKQGLGSKILSEAIAALKAQNIEAIELTVDVDNEAANRLYQKLGFQEAENLEDFYGPNQTRILLKRNITC